MIAPADALKELREGNRRFVSGETDAESLARRSHRPDLVEGQAPFAIILACSDSRVPVETVFDQGVGDLFVIRVAGNIAAPTQIGSVEYAAAVLGARLVVVLGHTNCGAVAATLDGLVGKAANPSPNLRAIVDRVRPAVEPVLAEHPGADVAAVIPAAVRANIRAAVERLSRDSQILQQRIEDDELIVVGAEYSIETGEVEFFDGDPG